MFNLSKDKVVGKKITEVYPNLKESSFDWIGTFGEIAIAGEMLCSNTILLKWRK